MDISCCSVSVDVCASDDVIAFKGLVIGTASRRPLNPSSALNFLDMAGADESIISLVNLPNLQVLDNGAFRGAAGTVEMLGAFPSLEFIGQEGFATFTKTSKVNVRLEGAPALRCIGRSAFDSTAHTAAASVIMTIRGDYPCLILEDTGTGADTDAFNSPRAFAGDANKHFLDADFGTQGCDGGTNGAPVVKCHVAGGSCTAMHGNTRYAPCKAASPYYQAGLASDLRAANYEMHLNGSPDAKNCSLGLDNDLKVGCIDAAATNLYCAADRENSDGNTLCPLLTDEAPVEIVGRDDVTEIHYSAFLGYASKLVVHGRFKRLVRIQALAFRTCGTVDSLIEFKDGDLPQLVREHDAPVFPTPTLLTCLRGDLFLRLCFAAPYACVADEFS